MSTPTTTSTAAPPEKSGRQEEKAARAHFSSLPYLVILLVSLIILAVVLYLSLVTGRYPMSTEELFQILGKNWFGMKYKVYKPAENMLFTVRLPRLLAAGLIGAALALAGACFQAVFRNPLVSPTCWGFRRVPLWGRPGLFCWG